VENIIGGKEAEQLKKLFAGHDENSTNIAELAIGTNKNCRLIGIIREDKKRLGTWHIGFGDNMSLGGFVESSLHFDILMISPTVTVDDQVIMKDGVLEI